MFSRKLLTIFTLFLALVLIGAGCGGQDSNQQKEASKVEEEIKKDIKEAAEKQKEEKEKETELTLEAESVGKGQVNFSWELKGDKTADRFVIVRDTEKNPKHNGKNYWFRQPGSRRDVTWVNIPSGDYHFRICILEDEKCTTYSNDVQVEVK
jgi:hypothetical protein